MNLFIKLLLLSLVLAVAAPLFLKGPNGKPLMSISDLTPSLPELKEGIENGTEALGPGKTKIYKWKDENGQWQLSDSPPMSVKLAEEAERRKQQAVFGNANNPANNIDANLASAQQLADQNTQAALSAINQSANDPNVGSNVQGQVNNLNAQFENGGPDPHAAAYQVQEIVVDANANVMQSLSTAKIDKALGRTSANSTAGIAKAASGKQKGGGKDLGLDKLGELGGLSPMTVPVDQIGQLIQNAQAAKGLIEDRGNEIDKMLQKK